MPFNIIRLKGLIQNEFFIDRVDIGWWAVAAQNLRTMRSPRTDDGQSPIQSLIEIQNTRYGWLVEGSITPAKRPEILRFSKRSKFHALNLDGDKNLQSYLSGSPARTLSSAVPWLIWNARLNPLWIQNNQTNHRSASAKMRTEDAARQSRL